MKTRLKVKQVGYIQVLDGDVYERVYKWDRNE